MVARATPAPEGDDDKPVTMGTLTKILEGLVKDDNDKPPRAAEPPGATSSRAEPAAPLGLTDQIELALRRREEARRLERGSATPAPPVDAPKSWREKLFG